MPYAAPAANLVDLYLRLSVEKDGKDSLDRQEKDLRKWAAAAGLTVRKVWRDAGKSGYNRNVKRPDFESAIAAVTSGEVGTLAVWKLDRLSRQGAGQVGTVLDSVDAIRGRLFFLKDSLDSSNSNSRMLIVLVSEQARAESANTSIRVRSKKARSREEGRYLGGARPFGYLVSEDQKLRPHPEEAALVRELVDRLLGGEAMLAVCRDWNTRGIPTRRGGTAWRPSTVSNMVRSPVLAGLVPAKRRDETKAGKPGQYAMQDAAWTNSDGEQVSLMAEGEAPIVSEGERRRLLDLLDGRLRQYGRGRRPVKQPKSLLGGLIRCAWCHRPANTFGNSYRCRRSFADGSECEHPLTVSVTTVEAAVRHAWARGLATLEPGDPILDAVADKWLARNDPAPIAERAELRGLLDDARARMADADDAYYVKGTLDAERYGRVTSALSERIRGLEARLSSLPEPHADLGPLLDPELSLPAINSADVAQARELLRLAIDRIEVAAAPGPGVRFVPHERLAIKWVGESDSDFTARLEPLGDRLVAAGLTKRPMRKPAAKKEGPHFGRAPLAARV